MLPILVTGSLDGKMLGENSSASSSVPVLSSAVVPCSPLRLHPLRRPPPHPLRDKTLFDDSAADILGGSRLGNKFRGLSESQVLRSSSTDKERASNVAKIKVVEHLICYY
ncbi:hypothetical protein Ahy_B08g090156 [Arachis hypogaea]|uniref:Uncharacterized protein n=1 Tax=Arachis hypogaea TaxID=3818 RepID=A0A444XZM0_ARAHY|nr:hypothetical protein Ahy_B08g090156 [Arachis hypogaea]